MEIHRENGIDEVSFAFRILEISEDKWILLKDAILDLDLDVEINEERRNIIININQEENVYTIIQFCEVFSIREGNLYCSILSSYDSGGLRLPPHIIDLIKKIENIEIDFSFIVC